MTCSIFRNEAGNVERVLAPNGEESKLYSDILALPDIQGDEEVAVDMYLLAYTSPFKDYFGDFENGVANGLIDSNNEPFVSSVMKFLTTKSDVEFTKPTKTVAAPPEPLAENEVNAVLKVVNALSNLSQSQEDKRTRKYGEENQPERLTIRLNTKEQPFLEENIRKTLANKGVPKQQIQFVFDYMKENNIKEISTEELAASIAADYSYAIEINTAKESMSDSKLQELSRKKEFQKDNFKYFSDNQGYWRFDNTIDSKDRKLERIDLSDFTKAYRESIEASPSKAYSNLTVPGGTNYTENEIATPAITPSIKGHAQFATDKGIGWFRSDDRIPFNEALPVPNNYKYIIRRILELQSDLFQKGRDKSDLIGEVQGLEVPNPNYFDSQEDYNKAFEEYLESIPDRNTPNQFLQLLNKDNNWVTFFVKSIIQDSAKKGYEKVVFPTGATAYKIESSGNTIENYIKNKEDRIKFLSGYYVVRDSSGSIFYRTDTKEDAEDYAKKKESYKVVSSVELNANKTEIEQVKREIKNAKEGASGLAATAKFYETTVANILKKQGYNPKQITDAYGNTWNEVTIDTERDKGKVLFQKEAPTTIPAIENLDSVRKVLDRLREKFGVEYVIVNEPNSDWKGKFQNGKVYINAAKQITKDTPFHEYLHPFVDVLKKENPSLHKKLLNDLQSIDEGLAEIENVRQSTGYSSLTEEDILDEALVSYIGKLASGNISSKGDVTESKEAGIRQSMLSQFKNWLRKMLNKLFSIKLTDLELNYNLQDIANMVSLSDAKIDVTGLNVTTKSNYQLDDRTRKFKDRIRAKANDLQKKIIDELYFEAKPGEEDPGRVLLEEASHVYMHTKTGQVYTSTTMAIKGEMNDPDGKYELNRLFGNHFDKAFQNIVEGKTFEEAKADMSDIVSEDISRRAYDLLKGIVVGLTSDGSVIVPQFVVADPASGIAGSLDILLIKPNGEMFIKDLKVSKTKTTSSDYTTFKHSVNKGSLLMGEKITTQQQHNIQVAVYKRLTEIMGLPISGTSTIHINLLLEGTGDQQKIKDFILEDEQEHLPTSNEAFVNKIVPTKGNKNKVAGFRKTLGLNNPANDDNFLDESEEMPEEIPADVQAQLKETIQTYRDKLRKRMDYLKNLNQTRFDSFSDESKELAIDRISELLSIVEIKTIGAPDIAFGALLNYTKDTLDSLYRYISNPANVDKENYIDIILEAEKFVESYRDIASIPEIGLGSQEQYALMRSVQSRLNAVKAEINPALEEYVKDLIRQKLGNTISEEELTKLLKEGYDINLGEFGLTDMQNTKEKLLAIAANLWTEADQKAKNKNDTFQARIKAAGNKLASALGTNKIDFSFMLNFDAEGNFTGRYLQAIGQKYYDIKRKVYSLLKNEEGESMDYIEIPDLALATPEQIAHNIEVQKRKEEIQKFRQAEQLDGKNQIISGDHHRLTNEFKNERAKYEVPNGQALQKGILVWVQKIGVSDEAYRKYRDRWYDRVQYMGAVFEKDGVYAGKTANKVGYFPKSKCVEIKEITNDGEDMRDPRYVSLMNGRSASEVAQKEFYSIYIEEMKAGLESLTLDEQQKMLGKVARVKDNYLNAAKRKGTSHFKAVTKGVRNWFDISPKMHSTQRLTDDEGVPVDNLPVLYTNNARNEKRIASLEQKIKELKDKYIVAKALTSEEYEGELKKLQLSLAIENSKIDYNDINTDLVQNLIAFRSMTEKYEQMSNIESSLLAIAKIVEKKKYYQSGSEDKKFVSKGVDKKDIYKAEGASRAHERMKKWFKMVYYNNDEYDYSQFAQVAQKIQNLTSLKGIGFNIFGGINNYVMGRINNAIEAYGGVYYERKAYFKAVGQYNKDYMPGAMKRIGSSNEGPYKMDKHYSKYEAIVSYFRMVRKFQEDAGKLTGNKVTEAAYVFQEVGEYNVQSKTGMAIVMGDKFQLTHNQTGETLSIYDAFTFDEQKNELTLKPGFEISEDYKTKVTTYVYEVNKQIHGNYAHEDRMVIQQHALGQLGAQFHKWVMPAFNARFKERYDNVTLGTIEGRYRTFYNVMKHVYQTEQGFLAKTVGMLGAFIPGSKTYQNMDELQVKNMYKNIAELGFFMASVLAAHLFKLLASGLDDDDEQVKKLMNFLIYQQTRQQNEIKTMIPIVGWSEQFQMLKSPIAAVGSMKDYGEVIAAIANLPFPPYDKNYYERGPYDGQLKAWKQAKDVIPALNILNRWESFETVNNFYIR